MTGHKVLIADDQILFAESLKYVLTQLSDLSVVGLAGDGEEALEMTDRLHPDVVLMDVRMPVMDGVEAAKLLRVLHPEVKVVMLTTFDDDEYVHFAMKYGAVGYILKNIKPDDLIASIRAILGGATLFSKEVTFKVVKEQEGQSTVGELERLIGGLSSREKEALGYVMATLSNAQIAERMYLSQQSIRNYMSSLYHTFGVSGRFALIQKLRHIWPSSQE